MREFQLVRILGCLLYAFLTAAMPSSASAQDRPRLVTVEQRASLDQLELREVFQLVIRHPTLEPLLQEGVDRLSSQLTGSGDPVEGWSAEGININARARAMEAERGSAYLLHYSDERMSINYLSEPRDVLGAGYARHSLIEKHPDGEVETTLTLLFPGIWVEEVSANSYFENANCHLGVIRAAVLTDRPVSTWSDRELVTVAMVTEIFVRFADRKFCVVFHDAGNGSYESKRYTPDGVPLPMLDENDRPSAIVDGDRLAELLP